MSLIIIFHNDATGVAPYGNYDVEVSLNLEKVLLRTRIEGHDRRAGWQELVRSFVREKVKNDQDTAL